jgi:hypothetical protein
METYSTIGTGVKVTDRVFTSDQLGEAETPFKYVIKNLEGRLIGHLVFKNGENEGILNEDLLSVLIDRLATQQEGIKKAREIGFALARCEEALMWLKSRVK